MNDTKSNPSPRALVDVVPLPPAAAAALAKAIGEPPTVAEIEVEADPHVFAYEVELDPSLQPRALANTTEPVERAASTIDLRKHLQLAAPHKARNVTTQTPVRALAKAEPPHRLRQQSSALIKTTRLLQQSSDLSKTTPKLPDRSSRIDQAGSIRLPDPGVHEITMIPAVMNSAGFMTCQNLAKKSNPSMRLLVRLMYPTASMRAKLKEEIAAWHVDGLIDAVAAKTKLAKVDVLMPTLTRRARVGFTLRQAVAIPRLQKRLTHSIVFNADRKNDEGFEINFASLDDVASWFETMEKVALGGGTSQRAEEFIDDAHEGCCSVLVDAPLLA